MPVYGWYGVVQAQACRAVRLSTIEVEGLGVRD